MIGVRKRGAALVLAALLLAALPLANGPARGEDDEAPQSSEQIEKLRAAIADSRERVGDHERRERELLDLLEGIDRNLDGLHQDVSKAERQARIASRELTRVGARLETLEADLGRTRRAMSSRAVALYKAGEVGPIRVLFSSVSLEGLLSKVWTLGRLLEYDADLVARFIRDRSDLEQVAIEAKATLERRDVARTRLRARSRLMRGESAEKRVLLAEVQGNRTTERALLNELETAGRALEETLRGFGGEPIDAAGSSIPSGFGQRRGALGAPVEGRIQQSFGRLVDAEYQTETFRNGVEFAAARGDMIRAVAPGKVRFTGWFRGYGKIVILDHGDEYFTVSGHLAEIHVELGDDIVEGDSLGTVGETGSLLGPSLYFEVRAGGRPLDPADWLGKG
jgi:septal ring factor EnvC (AmiA/AmiB activator)